MIGGFYNQIRKKAEPMGSEVSECIFKSPHMSSHPKIEHFHGIHCQIHSAQTKRIAATTLVQIPPIRSG
jgi:hypothetical protein